MTIAGLATLLAFAPVFVLSFVLLLSIIVFFHEFGHFSVARLVGVKVEVFSIGFGKTLAKWIDRHGTEWRISLLPLGGYVKFFGDDGPASNASAEIAEEREHEQKPATTQFPQPGEEDELASRLTPEEKAVCFHFKAVWARAAIVAAGPFANFILAIAMFWALIMAFGVQVADPKIGGVAPDSAAEEAGFQKGDVIVAANGQRVENFNDLTLVTRLGSGENIEFTVKRGDKTIVLNAAPRRQEVEDALGNKTNAGVLGVYADPNAVHFERYGPVRALGSATGEVWKILSTTVKFLGRLIAGKEDASQLGGPVKMAKYAGQAAMSGFDAGVKIDIWTRLAVSVATFVNLAAIVSVSIGFLNLLPIPILDGGHLMYYAYEAAAGKPLGARAQAIGFRVGIVLLASFMIFVTWNDISGFFAVKS